MKPHLLNKAVWSLSAAVFLLLTIALLPGCDKNPGRKSEGIRVGNGLRPGEELYESRFAFSFYYDRSLEISVTEDEEHIAVKAPGDPTSSVSFHVAPLPLIVPNQSNLESLKSVANEKVGPEGQVEGPLDHGGTRGYFSQIDEQSFIYFLLLPNGRYLQMTSDVRSTTPTASKLLQIPSRVMVDFTPPKVHSLQWEGPHNTASAGTQTSIIATATDSGVGVDTERDSCLMLRPIVRHYPGQGISHCTTWKEIGVNRYEYRFNMDKYVASGEYELESIEIFDRAGNRTIPTTTPGNLNVLNEGLQDAEPPEINGVFVRGTNVIAGTETQLVMELRDSESGIAPYISSCATFAKRGAENHFGIEACGSLAWEDEYRYSLPINVSPYVPAGDYYLTSVTARDLAGNYRTLVLSKSGFLEDFTGGKNKNRKVKAPELTVVNFRAPDTERPHVSQIKFPLSKARGSSLAITFQVCDDVSGFDFTAPVSVVLQPTDPRMKHLKISVSATAICMDADNWLIEIPIPKLANPGKYRLVELQTFDFAGNQSETLLAESEIFITP